MFGVRGLEKAKEIFGSQTRLARDLDESGYIYHPTHGAPFVGRCGENVKVLADPPHLELRPDKEFDSYYAGGFGWS